MNDYMKVRARQQVCRALKSGKLTKMPCEVCGDEWSEAHHEDYSKPLEVMWLCKRHHTDRHMEIGFYHTAAAENNPEPQTIGE